jgi:hypothetical protein
LNNVASHIVSSIFLIAPFLKFSLQEDYQHHHWELQQLYL